MMIPAQPLETTTTDHPRFVQITLGLWHVHSKQILHRDLKVSARLLLPLACHHLWGL